MEEEGAALHFSLFLIVFRYARMVQLVVCCTGKKSNLDNLWDFAIIFCVLQKCVCNIKFVSK